MFPEIVGTKDYRKPEWVAHMEEMQEALKGKVPILSRSSLAERLLIIHLLRIAMIRVVKIYILTIDKITSKYIFFDKAKLGLASIV